MAEYTVVWEIEIEANSPKEAAEKAQEIQRDIENIATVFTVKDENGKETEIDLWDR